MSKCYFIATKYDLPRVDHTKHTRMTVRELVDKGIVREEHLNIRKPSDWESVISCYDTAEDLHALKISISNRDLRDEGYSIDKPYIHEINMNSNDKNLEHLFDFLRAYIHQGENLELWSTWLCNIQVKTVSYSTIPLSNLTINDLRKWESQDDYCLIITN